MIKVWQHKHPTFFQAVYKPNMRDYQHVADVQSDSLDEAFLWTNTVNAPWYVGNHHVVFHGSPDHGMTGCRSTSIGDILEKDGRFYEVRPVGFERIDVWNDSTPWDKTT